ncbi:MAG: beta-lactamase family protein, partial [Gemmatimonadetes bacterium]|nr:beta-lactamase family protein [Gemmatimonadota bacterium]
MRLRLALLFTVALPAGPILAQQVPSIARTPVDTLASERVVGPVGIRLDQLLRRYEAYGFSGAALVSLNDSIVLLRGYGFADRERDIRNSPATRFEINSITKSFTAAAILQLEERGLLHTADPVTRYLGRFRPEKASATIDHLATHTAGLVADGSPLDGSTRASFVESVKHAAIEARPGRTYRYTNAAYSMMAAIVETVSGQSYEEYARDHLFRPAGLLATTFRGLTSADDPLFARGYVGTPGSPRPAGPE